MNYYNPYFSVYPYATGAARTGLFSRLLSGMRGINFSSIVSGTQKTLNIVNQTIPLVKQAKPIMNNAKTMFKVMNEFKKVNTPTIKKNINKVKEESKEYIDITKKNIGPNFFI